MIGLALDDVAIDGCLTKAPSGGAVTGRSPVDRGKQGLKRMVATDGAGVPLAVVAAGAVRERGERIRHDAPLLAPTLAALDDLDPLPGNVTVHLDRAFDGAPTRALLTELGFTDAIARKGVPAPVQAGLRWVVERTHSWMNGYGKLRRCTEKRRVVVEFYLFFAAAVVVVRQLIHHARHRYRWPTRPTTRRLK